MSVVIKIFVYVKSEGTLTQQAPYQSIGKIEFQTGLMLRRFRISIFLSHPRVGCRPNCWDVGQQINNAHLGAYRHSPILCMSTNSTRCGKSEFLLIR